MRKLFFLFLFAPIATLQAQLHHPFTKKENVEENYHGTTVADPYRWLEDDNSEATKQWVTDQNKVTFGYLDKINFRR